MESLSIISSSGGPAGLLGKCDEFVKLELFVKFVFAKFRLLLGGYDELFGFVKFGLLFGGCDEFAKFVLFVFADAEVLLGECDEFAKFGLFVKFRLFVLAAVGFV